MSIYNNMIFGYMHSQQELEIFRRIYLIFRRFDMKYTRLIIIASAVLLLFIGASVAYNLTSGKTASQSLSTAEASKTADSTQASTKASTTEVTSQTLSVKEGLDIGNLAYDFTLSNYAGDEITLSDLRGKAVILNFWASWCGPCRQEMPEFQVMQDELDAQGGQSDFVFLTVNLTDGKRETKDTAQAFLEENGYTFPVVFDSGELAGQYMITGIPSTFVLDKDGIIIQKFLGATNQAALEKALEKALESANS